MRGQIEAGENPKNIPWQKWIRNKVHTPSTLDRFRVAVIAMTATLWLLTGLATFEILPSIHQHSLMQKLCGDSRCNPFRSQAGQDRYVWNRFFRWSAVTGTFVEFGARDGLQHSNTAFFELERKWKGLLIEPFENRSTIL